MFDRMDLADRVRKERLGILCDRCGKGALGAASIDKKRYCHGNAKPSCYELSSHEWTKDSGWRRIR